MTNHELINGLKQTAIAHPCCRETMEMAAERIQKYEDLLKAVIGFRKYCQTACAARECRDYRSWNRRCPECPLDYRDELDARI